MKRFVALILLIAFIGGGVWCAYILDRMALSYLTGVRRMPGRDFWGAEVPKGGAIPGFSFIGISKVSEEPSGIRIVHPFEAGREIGLRAGDVITSVDGTNFVTWRDVMQHFLQNNEAGDVVAVVANRAGVVTEFRLTLKPYIRDPSDLALPFEEVEFQSQSGFRLRGWFIPPPDRSDGRAGVFVHGANASRYQALEQGAKYWYRRGYGLLTMDLSGRGSSEGDYITYTLNERHDVMSMLQWMRVRADVHPGRIVLFGTSNGASASIYAAARDWELRALALDAPYSDLWEAAGDMLHSRGVSPILRYPLSLAVRNRIGLDLTSVRPIDVIAEVKAPVFFLHGDADIEISPKHSERMHELRLEHGLPSERWVLRGGEHGFDNYPPEGIFWHRILDFFDKALGGAPREWELS